MSAPPPAPDRDRLYEPGEDVLRGIAGRGPAELGRSLWAGLLGRCPACRRSPMFSSLYGLHETCMACAVRYEREPGAYLGAIAIGYTIGALWIAAFAVIEVTLAPIRGVGWDPMWTIMASALLVTALAYRPAKGLWFALLYAYGFVHVDVPPPGEQES